MANQSKFDRAIASIVKNLAASGKTHKQIADLMEIHDATFYNWVRNNQQLKAALQQGKDSAIDLAESVLYKKAIGYFMTETKVFCHQGDIVTQDIQRWYPPDLGALIFYLKNARPEKWSDNPDPVDADNKGITLNWKPKGLPEPTQPSDEDEDDDFDELLG